MFEVYAIIGREQGVCPFYRGCPLLGVSVIGSSTVLVNLERSLAR